MIETKRLLLRRARCSDVTAFHQMMTDPAVMRYWSHPPHETLAQTEQFVAHMQRSGQADVEEYVIEHDGVCIGKVGAWKAPEVGFLLRRDRWGQGFAFEAMHAVLPRCFAKFTDACALTAEIDPRNAASHRLLARLDFKYQRTEKKNFLYGDEWCDTAYYALPRPSF